MKKIKKGDTVQILLGKDRDKTGKVLRLANKDRGVVVEGINVYKRHVRKTDQMQGGVIDMVKPVDISNVALICQSCKKPTKVGFKLEGDNKLRFCKLCKEVLKG